jgi:glycosyltransferase involved in cell wall biosynthesis
MSPELLLAAPAVAVALLVLLNALTWTRGRAAARDDRAWSVLVPARDEGRVIGATLAALRRTTAAEILVCDDHSTDDTPDLIRAAAAEDPRVRLVESRPLPDGWIGKAHACHQLAEAATGDWLLFVDADVTLSPDAVERLASVGRRADVVTAVPRQIMRGAIERLIVPLLHLTYLSWLWLPLVERARDERVVAANGQVLAVRRDVYAALGGFAAVRGAIVDDVAFCRRAKRLGHTVAFIDGFRLAACRMYQSGREVLEGFSKNLYAGIGATPFRLALVLTLYAAVYLAPWIALALSPLAPALLVPGLVGGAANLAVRAILAARWGHPWSQLPLHVVGIVGLFVVALNSARWHRAGALRWRGRVYAPESA